MAEEKQRGWLMRGSLGAGTNAPVPFFQAPGILERSGRSVAGPLRRGTLRENVGPRGGRPTFGSDMGMDRVTPRGFDPMGTSLERAPRQEASQLIARETRRVTRNST
jgi:hypothetical protein